MLEFAVCINQQCALLGVQLPLIYLGGSRVCKQCRGPLKIEGGGEAGKAENVTSYDLERYPTPLAISLQRLDLAKSPHERCFKLIEAITQLGKYVGLVGASDYLRKERNHPQLTELLTSKLARPHVSTWYDIVRLNVSDPESFLPQLAHTWKALNSSELTQDLQLTGLLLLNERGEEIERSVSLSPISFLLNFRNTIAHKTSLSEDLLRVYSEEAERALKLVLGQLSWLWEYTLIARCEDDRLTDTITLRGAREALDYDDSAEIEVVLQSPERDRELLLLPFYIAQKHISVERADMERAGQGELVVLEDIQDRHLLYLSPATGEGYLNQAYHPIWQGLIQSKTEQLIAPLELYEASCLTLHERSDHRLGLSQAHSGVTSKTRDQYFPRDEYERPLEKWLNHPAPLCIVSGEGGMGKTTLIAQQARLWSERGHVVLWCSAMRSALTSIESFVAQELGLARDLSTSIVQEILSEEDLHLIVVIDGLNENEHLDELLGAVYTELDRSTPCKLLLSTRHLPHAPEMVERRSRIFNPDSSLGSTEMVERRSRIFNPDSSLGSTETEVSIPHLQLINPDSSLGSTETEVSIPHLQLKHLSYLELSGMWSLISRTPKRTLHGHTVGWSPLFDLDELIERDEDAISLIQTPLQLSLFLMVFHRKPLPKTLGVEGVFERFTRYLKQWPRAGTLLEQVALFMWASHTRLVSTSDLFQELSRLGRADDYHAANGPLNQLIELGILDITRHQDQAVITARIDGMIEYIIASQLLADQRDQPLNTLTLPSREHPFGEGVMTSLIKQLCRARFPQAEAPTLRLILDATQQTDWPDDLIGYALAEYYGNRPERVIEGVLASMAEHILAADFSTLYHCAEALRGYRDRHAQCALQLVILLDERLGDQISARQRYDLSDELVYQYKRVERWDEVAKYADLTLALAEGLCEEEDQIELIARALNHIAFSAWTTSHLERGLLACDRAKELYLEAPERFKVQPKWTAYLEQNLAMGLLDYRRAEEAFETFKTLETDLNSLGYAILEFGSLKQQAGELTQARETFLQARDLLFKTGGPKEALLANVEIGYLDFLLGHHQQSLSSLNALYEAIWADEESPDSVRSRVSLFVGEVRNVTGHPDSVKPLKQAMELTRGKGDRLEVAALIFALIHLEDDLTEDELDEVFARLGELELTPSQQVIYQRTMAWKFLVLGEHAQVIEIIEGLYQTGGVTSDALRETGPDGQQARWGCALIGPQETYNCLFYWLSARVYHEGASAEILDVFDELLSSERRSDFPEYHAWMRYQLAHMLSEQARGELALFHARLSRDEYAQLVDPSHEDYEQVTALILRCVALLGDPLTLDEEWTRYVEACQAQGVRISAELQAHYVECSQA